MWIKAVEAASVRAGEMVCLELAGKRILVAATDSGWLAGDEMCTHEDASLCLGALRGTRVKCPLHGSWFDLVDGSVHDEPATEPLTIYPCREMNGWVEVEIR